MENHYKDNLRQKFTTDTHNMLAVKELIQKEQKTKL